MGLPPDFLVNDPVMFANSGDTFAYSGCVTGLDSSVNWAMAVQIVVPGSGVVVATSEGESPTITVTMTQASDFATTGNFDISLLALAATTATWGTATQGVAPQLEFDLKFYESGHPDPVLHSQTILIILRAPITP